MSECMCLTEARQHCSRYVPAGYAGFQDRANEWYLLDKCLCLKYEKSHHEIIKHRLIFATLYLYSIVSRQSFLLQLFLGLRF